MNAPLLTPRIKAKGAVPYGGEYALNRPDLGFVGTGTTFPLLLAKVRAWRHANGLPNGLGLEDEVEREICKLYPAECYETDIRVPEQRSLTVKDIIEGTRTMFRFKLAGSPFVSQEEANRRAVICANCPNNKDFSKPCAGICGELKDLVISAIGHKSTEFDPALKSCAVCHCFNAAAIWLPVDIQTASLSEEQRTQFKYAAEAFGCWKQ